MHQKSRHVQPYNHDTINVSQYNYCDCPNGNALTKTMKSIRPFSLGLLIQAVHCCESKEQQMWKITLLPCLRNWRGRWNKALSDTSCNVKFSFCFTSKYKAIWKESLVVNQTSLAAFFHAPLQLIPRVLSVVKIEVHRCSVQLHMSWKLVKNCHTIAKASLLLQQYQNSIYTIAILPQQSKWPQ